MINNSIKISKLHIIRKKKAFTFRWYTLHVLKFWQLLRFQIIVGLHFFLKHSVVLPTTYFMHCFFIFKVLTLVQCPFHRNSMHVLHREIHMDSPKSVTNKNIQGVPEKLCPFCLKIATKQQKILTNLFHDVALQMFN